MSSSLCPDCGKAYVGQTGRGSKKDTKNTTNLSGIITLRQNLHNVYRKMAMQLVIRRVLWKIYLLAKEVCILIAQKDFIFTRKEHFTMNLIINTLSVLKKHSKLLSIRETPTQYPHPTLIHFLISSFPHPNHSTSLPPPHTFLHLTTLQTTTLGRDGYTFWILFTVLLSGLST